MKRYKIEIYITSGFLKVENTYEWQLFTKHSSVSDWVLESKGFSKSWKRAFKEAKKSYKKLISMK